MTKKRVATIDIGTNSVLLLVGERDGASEVRSILDRATVTRLGKDVDQTGVLHPDACARTLSCLRDYVRQANELGVDAIRATGTSAVRDATNASSFLQESAAILGSNLLVLSGEEEARLSFVGAVHGLGVNGFVTVVDIGGGSTELAQGSVSGQQVSVQIALSKNVGSVRLTERHVRHDPPLPVELEAIHEDVRSGFHEVLSWPHRNNSLVVGVAGTVTTLAALVHRIDPYDATKIHGASLTLDNVNNALQHLVSMPLSARRNLIGMSPDRADVLIAGGILLQEAMFALGTSSLKVSQGGIRWGLLLETLWA